LNNKIFITGTSSGVGRCLLEYFPKDKILAPSRKQLNLDDPQLVSKYKLPICDYAFHIAGHDLGGGVNFTNHSEENIIKIFNCNLISTILLAKKIYEKNPNSKQFFITSTAIDNQTPNKLAYTVSKEGLSFFLKLLKKELPDIKIQEIRLGLTKSNFNINRHKLKHKPIDNLYSKPCLTPEYVAREIYDRMNNNEDFYVLAMPEYKIPGVYIPNKNKETFRDCDIACFGCTHTYGIHIDSPWPTALKDITKEDVCNFGIINGNLQEILGNVYYYSNHFKTKNIIIMIPSILRLQLFKNNNYINVANIHPEAEKLSLLGIKNLFDSIELKLKKCFDDIAKKSNLYFGTIEKKEYDYFKNSSISKYLIPYLNYKSFPRSVEGRYFSNEYSLHLAKSINTLL